MFTGIVTSVGTVAQVTEAGATRQVVIAADFDPTGLVIGASVACAGICLTVTGRTPEAGGTAFTVDIGPETLALTTAAAWDAGTRVNLERSLRIGDELGGHLVTGHIDGVANILRREDLGETVRFTFEAPAALARFIAAKGSVALDGTSLTVNTIDGVRFTCHLIPHTLAVTTWSDRRGGDAVNLEVDLMARYAARLTEMK
jgi:riboflavin synthase